MNADVSDKLEACILQVLERRRNSGLEGRQIALRLRSYGFTVNATEIRAVLQGMWQRGLLLKVQRDASWLPPLRWKLADGFGTSEIHLFTYHA